MVKFFIATNNLAQNLEMECFRDPKYYVLQQKIFQKSWCVYAVRCYNVCVFLHTYRCLIWRKIYAGRAVHSVSEMFRFYFIMETYILCQIIGIYLCWNFYAWLFGIVYSFGRYCSVIYWRTCPHVYATLSRKKEKVLLQIYDVYCNLCWVQFINRKCF